MKIGIIGAGFTGLAAAFTLQQRGHTVTVFEKDSQPGGLAVGYQEDGWDWTLEKHYHHWFTNDTAVLNLAKEINHPIVIRRPHTNWYVKNTIYEFDSISAALQFDALPLFDRVRNLGTLGLLRLNPFWKPLEQFNADAVLPAMMGKKAYRLLWQPLFENKFGDYAQDVSLAWFWARIKKRTQSLAYPSGGFLTFAQHLVTAVVEKKGTIFFNTELVRIHEENDKKIRLDFKHSNSHKNSETFDRVIVTLPSFLFLQTTPQLPQSYVQKLTRLKGLGASNLILRLSESFFADSTYWLSVADKNSPIMAVVEHTNFIDKKYYNNEHLIYLGNYLSPTHPNFAKNKSELLKMYDPFLKKINPSYKNHLIGYEVFKAPFAQPIIPRNYSQMIPPFTTPLHNVFLANIEQVYPWDRGTNYAVEIGTKVANIIDTTQ